MTRHSSAVSSHFPLLFFFFFVLAVERMKLAGSHDTDRWTRVPGPTSATSISTACCFHFVVRTLPGNLGTADTECSKKKSRLAKIAGTCTQRALPRANNTCCRGRKIAGYRMSRSLRPYREQLARRRLLKGLCGW